MSLTLNPTLVPVVLILSTGIVSGSVSTALNSRDAQDGRDFQKYQMAWNASMEAKFNDQRNFTEKTLVGLQKDVESANKTLSQIQSAMMGRPIPAPLTSQHTP